MISQKSNGLRTGQRGRKESRVNRSLRSLVKRVKKESRGKDEIMEKVKVKSYRDLLVWQKAHALVRKVLKECKEFPRTDEAREIKRQLIKAVTSVPANIAEGYGGCRGQAYRNYLIIARRSANETDY